MKKKVNANTVTVTNRMFLVAKQDSDGTFSPVMLRVGGIEMKRGLWALAELEPEAWNDLTLSKDGTYWTTSINDYKVTAMFNDAGWASLVSVEDTEEEHKVAEKRSLKLPGAKSRVNEAEEDA